MLTRCVLAVVVLGAQQAPTAADLVKLAGGHAVACDTKLSGVQLDEQYLLIEVAGMNMHHNRRLSSDIVLINLDRGLISLRDLYAIDTRPVRPPGARMAKAISELSQANLAAAERMGEENQHFFLADAVLRFSDPMLALLFVHPESQKRLTYKLDGRKRIDGVQLLGVGFKETQGPKAEYLLRMPDNPSSSGRFWIDPATGTILQAELWAQSTSETTRSLVTFTRDAESGCAVPREATHTLDIRERAAAQTRTGVGEMNVRQSFESKVTYKRKQ